MEEQVNRLVGKAWSKYLICFVRAPYLPAYLAIPVGGSLVPRPAE
jgi:hypothetical protein